MDSLRYASILIANIASNQNGLIKVRMFRKYHMETKPLREDLCYVLMETANRKFLLDKFYIYRELIVLIKKLVKFFLIKRLGI